MDHAGVGPGAASQGCRAQGQRVGSVSESRRNLTDLGLFLLSERQLRVHAVASENRTKTIGTQLLPGGSDQRHSVPGRVARHAVHRLELRSYARAALAY